MAVSEGIQSELVLPPPDELVGRKSSGQQVSLYIRRIVFDGVLLPGDRVPQDAIAFHLGLSRVPVREALLSLQREGWVRITPHRGAFISTLDEEVVRDHYELFGNLYSLASARAARRRTKRIWRRSPSSTRICNRLSTPKRPGAQTWHSSVP